ncbi:hypothetical protein L596_004591 [Steinernema carpocapsae]|uniref:Uncharacterized protein n=1 Tax=Steinernema carpocapsae TaxID=34508 RepID=A0A4U8UWF7_STECR|nr:hypothetical protein L596_004591 [Steinernema carpocapsae]
MLTLFKSTIERGSRKNGKSRSCCRRRPVRPGQKYKQPRLSEPRFLINSECCFDWCSDFCSSRQLSDMS